MEVSTVPCVHSCVQYLMHLYFESFQSTRSRHCQRSGQGIAFLQGISAEANARAGRNARIPPQREVERLVGMVRTLEPAWQSVRRLKFLAVDLVIEPSPFCIARCSWGRTPISCYPDTYKARIFSQNTPNCRQQCTIGLRSYQGGYCW